MNKIYYPEEGNELCYQVEPASYWFNHRNEVIFQILSKYKQSGAFWDVGGGNGFVSAYLQEKGFDCTLIEPGPKGCEYGKERGIKKVFNGILQDFTSEEQPEIIGAFDVVEHIEDDEGIVKEMYKRLSLNGVFISTVPAFQTLWSADDILAGHFKRYTTQTYTNLLKKAGFEIEYCSYFFSFIALPLYLLKAIPFKLSKKVPPHIDVEKAKSQHELKGLAKMVFEPWMAWEIKKIKQQQSIPFGSSVICMAKKI